MSCSYTFRCTIYIYSFWQIYSSIQDVKNYNNREYFYRLEMELGDGAMHLRAVESCIQRFGSHPGNERISIVDC